MMTGSCVMKSTYWEETVASMFDTLNAISTELGIEFEFVNVGGGLGIPYKPDEVRALPCAAAWKDMERHGKTWKDMEREAPPTHNHACRDRRAPQPLARRVYTRFVHNVLFSSSIFHHDVRDVLVI